MRKIAMMLALLGALLGASAVQASIITFEAILNGASEFPANASPGLGQATVIYDSDLHTLRVQSSFSGLLGNTTAAHIHCCTVLANTGTAGVATVLPSFTGFPLGVTAGSYDHLYDLTAAGAFGNGFVNANGGSLAAAEAALLQGMLGGKAYFNIHTSVFSGGEIRGFLQAVPEPGSLALIALGLAGLGLLRRPKRAPAAHALAA